MLLSAHSGFRYLVLLLGLIVVAYAAYGIAAKRPYDNRMRGLAAAFTGTLDLTAVLGLGNLFTDQFYPQLGGHIVMMVLAIAVAHVVSTVMRRRPPEQRTYAPHVVGTLVVLGIVVFGILAIRPSIVG
jgi:FtsH-binding integral membrane protein